MDPQRCPQCSAGYELSDNPPGSVAMRHAENCGLTAWQAPVVAHIGNADPAVLGLLFIQPGDCQSARFSAFLRAVADAVDAYHLAGHQSGACRASAN